MKRFLILVLTLFIISLLSFSFLRMGRGIIIMYTVDLQGFVTPHEYIWSRKEPKPLTGGSATLATFVKKMKGLARMQGKAFFLLDSGNFYSGTPEGNLFKGSSVIEIMNAIGYDAITIGPKDFAYGEENLKSLAKLAQFQFLGANIVKERTLEIVDYVRPYVIKSYKDIKIGIVGVTTPLLNDYPIFKNVEGLKFIYPILTTKKYVTCLKKEGVKLIIVLSNLGLDKDKELAAEVGGIDIIIGGNDREGGRYPTYVDPLHKTIIMESWEKGGSIYCFNFTLDRQGKIKKYNDVFKKEYTYGIRPDLEVQVMIQRYVSMVRERLKEKLGYVETAFLRNTKGESTLGNWVADVLREKTKAEIVLVAGLQADLKQGDITIQDIYNILPIIDRLDVFGFNLAVLELTGEQIKEMLEAGVSYGLEKGEGVLQVSGLKYIYDLKRKKWDRIVDVFVNGEKLDLGKTYKVTVNSYLASGLGGYYKIKEAKNRYDTGLMDFDVLVEYIKTHSPITAPPLEGRILRVDK